ncbi:transposase [Salmonella enterica subsp. enterica serovar Virchow]|nr:transposase [Salmonella enterica subsp. enterica serovar Virchow]
MCQANREAAWQWLFHQRRHAPADADIWHLRFHWPQMRDTFWQQVLRGEYRLSPLQVHRSRQGPCEAVALWCAADALVLRWVSLMVQNSLPVQENCTHVAGHRAGRDALRQISLHLQAGMTHVWRTDIRGYYRHISKVQLYHHVCRYVDSPVLRGLIKQYIGYSVEQGGEFHTPAAGISRGCSLSPLLGASFLWYIDQSFSGREDLFYVRYMDDFLVLSDRRWRVRHARRHLLAYFDDCGFECHPDKTHVGRTAKGFDWLGVWFTDTGPAGTAPRAQENYKQRREVLVQRCRRLRYTPDMTARRVQEYDIRWQRWAEGQLRAAQITPASPRAENDNRMRTER